MKAVSYRPPTPDDLAFITSSWLKSNRNSDFSNYIDNQDYYNLHGNLIKSLLTRSLVTVIHDPEDINHVYGYAVYELVNDIMILHYIYIKFSYRNFGLAKNCLKAVYPEFGNRPIFMTHVDRVVTRILQEDQAHIAKKTSCFIKKRDKYKLHYNPYLMAIEVK